MKSANKPRSDGSRALWWVAALWLGALAGMLLDSGCAHAVVPRAVEAREASFDGNEQNSGVLASLPSGFVVTPHLRERYAALVSVYGRDFAPALTIDSGIAQAADGTWLMSKQAMAHFLEMNAWRRAGLKPKNP